MAVTFPIEWTKDYPSFLEKIPKTFETVVSDTLIKQFEINENWFSKTWRGICNELTNVSEPPLMITGTEDVGGVPAVDSLILADKIPGAWLVQTQEAGHGLMHQFTEKFTTIIETFLDETQNSR